MKTVTIKDSAKQLGISEQALRMGLRQNLFPFGVAVKHEKSYMYYIFEKRLEKYLKGELQKGETMKRDYIFITRNRKKLYLDTFKRNVLMPIAFLLGTAVFFVTMWFMFLLAYAFQG